MRVCRKWNPLWENFWRMNETKFLDKGWEKQRSGRPWTCIISHNKRLVSTTPKILSLVDWWHKQRIWNDWRIVLPWYDLTISFTKALISQSFLALFSIIEGAASWVQIFQRHCTICTRAVPYCCEIGLSVHRQYNITMGIVSSVHKWCNIVTRLY